jgi:hypothetical protein
VKKGRERGFHGMEIFGTFGENDVGRSKGGREEKLASWSLRLAVPSPARISGPNPQSLGAAASPAGASIR